MNLSIDPHTLESTLAQLSVANRRFSASYPGEPAGRQPVHSVYGGAHLYRAETTQKLGELSLSHLNRYAPDAQEFARALGIDAKLADAVYSRTIAKLQREAVEDFRIDFEDGYGNRPDAEEDATAVSAAKEVAKAHREGIISPFIGIRVKTMTDELKRRSVRTMDLFVTTLLDELGGLPDNFVITLPKIVIPEQVTASVDLLSAIEHKRGLPNGTLKIEMMIEATQAILGADGRSPLPLMLQAANGRCTGAHLGTYDFTASANITAMYQGMEHSACDFAKYMMTMAYASTGIFLSDGATNVMPIGPHTGELSAAQEAENREVVHSVWRTVYRNNRHSLKNGYFQGWDLHPGHLSIRYAACYSFFLEGLDAASARLSNFIRHAAQATRVGEVFDDAATGQGLLNYFLRAYNCGAITLEEIEATGLTREEIHGRSFVKILANRRKL